MAKQNSNIDIAFNEFDTMVTKFFEQAEISFRDVAKPQPIKETKKKRTPNFMNNPLVKEEM